MIRVNQPWVFKEDNQFGEKLVVSELISSNCGIPVPQISALNQPEFGELMLLGFDVEPALYEWNGQIEMAAFGPKIVLNGLKISEKNMHKVFGGEVMIDTLKATVREFGNDLWEYVVTADIDNDITWTFTTVSGLQEWDFVKIAKRSKDSKAITSRVKIKAVDNVTKEVTFDTPVTMTKGDVIRYKNTAQGGCLDNTKRVWDFDGQGLSFDYNTQFFSREVLVETIEFNKYFNKGSQQYEVFASKFWIRPATDIFKQVASQFRYGSWIGGPTSEIMWYDTIIENREANGLKSIHDFEAFTTAEDLQKELEYVLERVKRAPVKSEFVMIVNERFYESYKNMMRKLYDDEKARACCKFDDSLYNGMMKWNIEEAPMLDVYVSQSLTLDEDFMWVAYILPKDLIAGFVPNVFNVTLTEWANSKLQTTNATPNMFWTIFTREKVSKATAECKVYEHYTRLWFLYAWVSFRDTYHRIDNFNYNLRF